MFRHATGTLYRQVAAEGATYIGLLVVVYDCIAEDLRRAGIAAATNDIATRCDVSNHALLLLGHLESWAADMEEQNLQRSLIHFYTYVRSTIMALQTQTAAEPFHKLAGEVTGLRMAWQQKESQVGHARTRTEVEGTEATLPLRGDDPSHHGSRWSA